MNKFLLLLLAILMVVVPFARFILPEASTLTDFYSDLILAITAVIVLSYTWITHRLYKTTHDSNRILSFSGLVVDKAAPKEKCQIIIENNTQNSALNVYIISFLIDSACERKCTVDQEIQPFIHPKQPIEQSDIINEKIPNNCPDFSQSPYHLVIGLLTPLMKKGEKEAMLFYFKDNDPPNRDFQHLHYHSKTKIYESSFQYVWDQYEKYKRKTNSE